MTRKAIRFVTDSTCDIPPQLVAEHRIGVVPCYVNFATESLVDDGVSISRDTFYARLATSRPLPTTAAPPAALVEEFLTRAFEDADHVVLLTAPKSVSGIHNAFRLATQSFPEDRVTLIDAGSTSMGLGWQVILAAEVARDTGDVEAVLNAIAGVRRSTTLLAALATMEYLKHGGRVSWLTASLGSVLQIKPIIEVREGEVVSAARVRTFHRAVDELIELTHRYAPLDRLAIIHTGQEEAAAGLRDRLSDVAPLDTLLVHVTPVLGVHAGPGALGISPVSKSWRT